MAERKVLIQCMANSTVSINKPDIKLSVLWKGRGDKRVISYENLQEALYDAGVKALFDRGYLYVVNKEDRIDLEFEDAEEQVEKQVVLTDEQRAYYLTQANMQEFKEMLSKLSEVQLDLLVEYAVDNKAITMVKNDIIKRFCNKDVVRLIEIKRLKEEG